MAQSGIICIGEALWDSLPAGLFVGGAPYNVAFHLHELGRPVALASRVGADELGREILRRMARRGLSDACMQVDPTLPTGFVMVELDRAGTPRFEIVEPSAWDAIEPQDRLLAAADRASALVFGSLGQRGAVSRATIRRLWETPALKVFDVNLRPPFDRRDIVEESLARAWLVKLNDQEFAQLARWFGLPADLRAGMPALAERFACSSVCVTRGAEGVALWRDGEWREHPGYRIAVADTVGAGDAFLAALLVRLLDDCPTDETLRFANAVGAYVASQNGATPRLDMDVIRDIQNSRGGQ